jgi:hypothetical protein
MFTNSRDLATLHMLEMEKLRFSTQLRSQLPSGEYIITHARVGFALYRLHPVSTSQKSIITLTSAPQLLPPPISYVCIRKGWKSSGNKGPVDLHMYVDQKLSSSAFPNYPEFVRLRSSPYVGVVVLDNTVLYNGAEAGLLSLMAMNTKINVYITVSVQDWQSSQTRVEILTARDDDQEAQSRTRIKISGPQQSPRGLLWEFRVNISGVMLPGRCYFVKVQAEVKFTPIPGREFLQEETITCSTSDFVMS